MVLFHLIVIFVYAVVVVLLGLMFRRWDFVSIGLQVIAAIILSIVGLLFIIALNYSPY